MSIDATVGTAAVRTNELGIREIVRRLNSGLGPTLVAGLTGSKDRRISHKWAKEDGPEPNAAAVRRLMSAIRLWTELSDAHGEHVARLWFIGSNPWLDEDSPVEAIMEDRFKEVRVAANAMLTGGFSG
ncbi:MAG TPA: hypothetical protein VFI36_00745 [Arthrobacter sp.]|nr:hypothetical protein [Arthrobacter sp.]